MSSDDMPSLASLRRRPKKRASATKPATTAQTPSLFELFAEYGNPAPASSAEAAVPLKSAQLPEPEPTRVWSVTALVREVRGLVEQRYGQVAVEGEISNWRPANSGHCYFTLKDGDAQLSVVMFRRAASFLRFRPKDGDAVRLRGQVSVYENRGQMQIIAASMELAGQGALLAAVQALKERLRREGLFERKRTLPAFPKCIGVITSVQGAALRDIVKVCRRRHAAVNLLIYPAAMQGTQCPPQVIAGLHWFSRHKDRADVVLVARGGGSWDDLHGFDDEGIVRAIAACELPVISGIGHATDTTIADAAADVCAPTPSAAAELLTEAQHRVEDRVQRLHARVLRAGRYEMMRVRQRLTDVGADAVLRRAVEGIRRREQRLDELGFRAENATARLLRLWRARMTATDTRLQRQDVALRLAASKQRLTQLSQRMNAAETQLTTRRRTATDQSTARLHALSPLRVLERGYALVYAPDGTLLRSADTVTSGDVVTARVAKGTLRAAVLDTTKP